MRGVSRLFTRLYPAQWRARYGEEFETLIEDSGLGWRAMFDLLKGAIRMQLNVPAFPKLAVILSMLGLAAGFGVSLLMTPRYISTSEMQIVFGPLAQSAPRPNLRERLIQMQQEILSRTSLSHVIQDPRLDLYQSERTRLPLEDVIEQMRRRDVMIRAQSPTSDYVNFTVSFGYSDPVKARDTVQSLITKFMDLNQVMQSTAATVKRYQYRDQIDRLETRIATLEKRLGVQSSPAIETSDEAELASFGGINIDVLDVPSLPVNPIYPNRNVFMAVGFSAGFASAVVIGIFRRRPASLPFQPAQAA